MAGSWTGGWAPADGARLRLICFAHAGGGGAFFRPWRVALLPEIAVCPVVLPGREGRRKERACRHIDELIGPLCDALAEHVRAPYALLGHSMGAVIAYEVARQFSAAARPPRRLVVSGRRAPQVGVMRSARHRLPEQEFIEMVTALNGTPASVLHDRELAELFLPCLRADFELVETYAPRPGGLLTCPISALIGAADPEVTTAEMLAWRDVTTGPFSLRVFPGDHFYLKDAPDPAVAAVRADLLGSPGHR